MVNRSRHSLLILINGSVSGPNLFTGQNCENSIAARVATARRGRSDCFVYAAAGDKRGQLELGIRYEEGRGVPSNLRRAERLYASAARTRQIPNYVYSGPVGNEKSGRLVPIGRRARSPASPRRARGSPACGRRGADADRC